MTGSSITISELACPGGIAHSFTRSRDFPALRIPFYQEDIVVMISPEHLFLAFSKQLKTGASLPHSILSAGILTGMQAKSALKMLDLTLARAGQL